MEKNEEFFIKIIQNIDQGACLLKNRSMIYKNTLFDQSIINQEVSSLLNKSSNPEVSPGHQSENAIQHAKKIILDSTYSIILLSSKKEFEFTIDSLTGLLNKECFTRVSEQLAEDAKNFAKIICFLFISIDPHEALNGNKGQQVANQVYKKCAERMNYATRANDFCFRFGENEFVIVLTDIKYKMHSSTVAKRLISSISEPISVDNGKEVIVSSNIGISCYPIDESDINKIIEIAEKTMHLAKQMGKNNYQIHN